MSKVDTRPYSTNGNSEYFELFVRGCGIGVAQKVEDGWLVVGRRKPVATIEEAAKQMLDNRLSQHKNDIDKLRAMLAYVLAK